MHLNGAQGRGISALCVPLPDMAQAGLRTTAKQVASRKGIHRCCRNGIGVLDILCF